MTSKALLTLDQDRARSAGFFSEHASDGDMTECGIGALMPWTDRLYYATYLANAGDGAGTEIGYLDRNFAQHTVLATDGITAGRFIHDETAQMCIGPCVIEKDGTAHTIANLVDLRVAGFARHLVSPTTKVYALTMEGKLYEVDLTTYANAVLVMDIADKLSLTAAHFKACWTHESPFAATNRVICVSNVQYSATATASGVLVAVDPVGDTASIKEQNSCIEVAGSYYPGNGGITFALGRDSKSPFIGVVAVNNGSLYKYRLPAWTRSQDWYISQEWMRIRPVTTERFVFNAYGTWYSLSTWLASAAASGVENYGTEGTNYPVVEPISTYIDTVTDFCVWNGKFCIGSNNMSFHNGAFPNAGQPNSVIKFGNIEDLWAGGKPHGRGMIWDRQATTSGTNSDPMLIRGYGDKALHFYNAGAATVNVLVKLVYHSQVFTLATVSATKDTLVTYQIPTGVGADWVMLATDADNTSMTAWLECVR